MSVPDAKFTKGEFEVSTPCSAPRAHCGRGKASLAGGSGGTFRALSTLAFFHLVTRVLLCSHFTDEQTEARGWLALEPWQMTVGDEGPGSPSSCLTLLLGYCVPWGRPLATILSREH